MSNKLKIGSIGWIDLTVNNADEIKDFYSAVVGWKPENVSMGDYNDYNMISAESGDPCAGICNKRGVNSNLPSVWMAYFIVEDISKSIASVKGFGGKVLVEPKEMGGQGKYAVIEDPAGAVCALFEQM
ncbi:MAG: VOC family protein [Melioribacteraceae bacterium]|nr:VOC family protein [Melioribacteraceae bacterium]